jgi:hypothetical protein
MASNQIEESKQTIARLSENPIYQEYLKIKQVIEIGAMTERIIQKNVLYVQKAEQPPVQQMPQQPRPRPVPQYPQQPSQYPQVQQMPPQYPPQQMQQPPQQMPPQYPPQQYVQQQQYTQPQQSQVDSFGYPINQQQPQPVRGRPSQVPQPSSTEEQMAYEEEQNFNPVKPTEEIGVNEAPPKLDGLPEWSED